MTLRMPVDLYEWITEYAEKKRMSVNFAIVDLINKKFYAETRKGKVKTLQESEVLQKMIQQEINARKKQEEE